MKYFLLLFLLFTTLVYGLPHSGNATYKLTIIHGIVDTYEDGSLIEADKIVEYRYYASDANDLNQIISNRLTIKNQYTNVNNEIVTEIDISSWPFGTYYVCATAVEAGDADGYYSNGGIESACSSIITTPHTGLELNPPVLIIW